jgi:phosphatidylserine decarboxylase
MQEVTVWERIKGWLFHLFPHHLVSRATFWLTRLETPLKDPLVRLYIRAFRVDMSEALEPDPRAYPTFNAFFTRAMRPGARPIANESRVIACPADGKISQLGVIREGRIIQAKAQDFSVVELLGGSESRAAPFANGSFCTIYLSPRDYHRVHMPVDGRLLEMVHVPGRLFSVAPYAPRVIPRVFARNERVAAIFATHFGIMALVMVGAVNVAAIETAWAGLITPPAGKAIRSVNYREHPLVVRLARGQEMGRFNMGSTAILLFATKDLMWEPWLRTGKQTRMGQQIGLAARSADVRPDQAFSQENAITSEM